MAALPRTAMHQTPPTVPLPGTAATEPQPPRGPRTSFYVTVGCLSVIAGLVLGVGGFFGVRALQEDGDTSVADGEGSEGGGGQEGEAATPGEEPQTLDERPVGPEAAVPFGSTFPVHSDVLDGEVEVRLTALDWDATSAILEANSFTEEPKEGNKYILVAMEGVYRGGGTLDQVSGGWIGVAYVAPDGTEYSRVYRIIPNYADLSAQSGIAEGDTFLSEFPIEIPESIEGGGHVVLVDLGEKYEEGAWVEAA